MRDPADETAVGKPAPGGQIELRDVFNPRITRDGRKKEPSAGVGKTTLCKKAVDDFISHRAWSNLFDRLLWLQLRKLRLRTGRYNLTELFCDEFFSQHDECESLAKALRVACDKPDGGRTIYPRWIGRNLA